MLNEVHADFNLHFKHREKDFVDFLQGQILLPHKHSQGGPGITVGDVNSDKLEDFIIGGSASNPAKIFLQQKNGSFKNDSLQSKEAEDMGLLLFDADQDGDQDLYCVSGSSEFKNRQENYQDRLYRNTGNGKFQYDSTALPEIKAVAVVSLQMISIRMEISICLWEEELFRSVILNHQRVIC